MKNGGVILGDRDFRTIPCSGGKRRTPPKHQKKGVDFPERTQKKGKTTKNLMALKGKRR